jgi:4'-phosphopantetheinyl transferase
MATVEVVWGTVATVLAGLGDPVACLDPGERARRETLLRHEASDRFTAGRVLLRRSLGRVLGVEPDLLRFVLGEHGKPALDPPIPGAPAFNLAHTGDVVALALAPAATVGLDLEVLAERSSAERIAERRFAPAEVAWLAVQPDTRRTRAFLRLWTAKEAVLKALGTGIAGGLTAVELAPGPDGSLHIVRLPAAGPWTLLELSLRPDLLAAVALPGEPWQVAVTHT